jgi:hypothetical protein
LSVVLHGCEIWSFIFREEYQLEEFENNAHDPTQGKLID